MKKILLGILSLILLVGAFEAFCFGYYATLTDREKCILTSQIEILHESPFEARFYDDHTAVEMSCSNLNGSK